MNMHDRTDFEVIMVKVWLYFGKKKIESGFLELGGGMRGPLW